MLWVERLSWMLMGAYALTVVMLLATVVWAGLAFWREERQRTARLMDQLATEGADLLIRERERMS